AAVVRRHRAAEVRCREGRCDAGERAWSARSRDIHAVQSVVKTRQRARKDRQQVRVLIEFIAVRVVAPGVDEEYLAVQSGDRRRHRGPDHLRDCLKLAVEIETSGASEETVELL